MCQYGHQVTTSPTETVVLCCSPLATPPRRHSISKKRPLRRSAEGLRLRLFPNSHMAVFYSPPFYSPLRSTALRRGPPPREPTG